MSKYEKRSLAKKVVASLVLGTVFFTGTMPIGNTVYAAYDSKPNRTGLADRIDLGKIGEVQQQAVLTVRKSPTRRPEGPLINRWLSVRTSA